MPDLIRILLVDDHAVLRSGLRALFNLEPGLDHDALFGRERPNSLSGIAPLHDPTR